MSRIVLLSLSLVFAKLLTGCGDSCKVTQTYVYFEPVYQTTAEVRAAVQMQPPHTLTDLGRIYFKDGYLFINERGKGIHIIDNRTPAQPTQLSFLNIPGNYDLAIQGSTLYADSYIDLIAFDISSLANVKEVYRLEGVFNTYTTMGVRVGSSGTVITDWKQVENVHINEDACEMRLQPWGGMFYEDGIALTSSAAASFDGRAALAPTSSGAGVAGSMARFALKGDYLYALDGASLDVIDVKSVKQPQAVAQVNIAWDVETIFPYRENLFFGTQSGMLIYSVADPKAPTLISTYSHVRSCDPVVVEGDYAYVTLRSGTACQGFTNQLEVINITNLASPTLEKVCTMTNPHGLGIDNGTLFICDGTSGLRVIDASNVNNICNASLAHYTNINAFDVIPYGDVAMMISNDGLYQYDYSDPRNIRLLSTLKIAQ